MIARVPGEDGNMGGKWTAVRRRNQNGEWIRLNVKTNAVTIVPRISAQRMNRGNMWQTSAIERFALRFFVSCVRSLIRSIPRRLLVRRVRGITANRRQVLCQRSQVARYWQVGTGQKPGTHRRSRFQDRRCMLSKLNFGSSEVEPLHTDSHPCRDALPVGPAFNRQGKA